MNTAELVGGFLVAAVAVALAFVGLHTALTASTVFAGYVILPLARGQEHVRSYVLIGGHAAFIATSVAVGIALSFATARRVWLGKVAFVAAVAFFTIDWKQEGGSYFWALFDVLIVTYVACVLISAYLVRQFRRGLAA